MSRERWSHGTFPALVVLAALTGCGGHPPPQASLDADRCLKAVPDPGSLARFPELGGEHGLLLAARSGEREGASASGALTLMPRDSSGVPFYGWTDLDLAGVGAHELGDPGSRDISAPGVLVLVTSDASDPARVRSVTLRIGSQANRSDLLRFDGAFTALYVRWIDDDGFGGDWGSGVTGPEVTGTFCAVRPGDR